MRTPIAKPSIHAGAGLGVVFLGTLLAPLDTAVNLAFPHITGAFNQPLDAIQWVVICYVLTYASLMLVCGKLGDLFGYRRIFALGLIISAVALAACAKADSFAALLIFRVGQGIGTALVLSCSVALALSLFAEQRRTQILGLYTTAFGIGTVLGPGLAGPMIEAWGWTAVFWFRVPLALAALAATCILPAPKRRDGAGHFDLAGAGLIVIALVAGVLALNRLQGAQGHWPLAIALGAASVVAFVLFAVQEHRAPQPIIRPSLFRQAGFAAINLANGVINLVGFAVLLLVPYYLAIASTFSVGLAGAVLALAPFGFILGSMLGGPLAARLAANRICLFALLVVAVGLYAVSGWGTDADWLALAPPLLLVGFGQGVFQVCYMEIVVARLPVTERGVAGSLALLTRTVGVVFGATILTMVFTALRTGGHGAGGETTAGFMAAFAATFEIAAAAAMLFVLATMLRPRTWFG